MDILWTPWLGIKQIPHRLVKRPSRRLSALTWAIIGVLAVATVAVPSRARADDENLPEIEARTFDVKVMRRSRSGRVYLFVTQESMPLHTGKILLLRQNDQPVMAFRVLRDYSEKNEFAAKWVRQYPGITRLEPTESYVAIEKIADREAPPLTAQDREELKEVESEIPPPPVEEPLPPPTAPEKQKPVPSSKGLSAADLTPADEADIDELKSLTAQELVPFDRYWNWFTMGFGFFRNNGATPTANSGYFSGFDMKYAKTLKQMVYFKRRDLQDSIVVEGGLGYYKAISFAAANDSYTVFPLTVTARYNLIFSESFSAFVYGGLNKNFVASSAAATTGDQAAVSVASDQLNSLLPAVGVGALFHVGPSWYIRVDTGLDLLGVALLLRF